jgi:1-acyl-sn-glycerol-3-phosphate acyltransferase
VPLLGQLLRRLGFISVRRGSADAAGALDEAAEALAAGEAVGLYPEGRLTRDPMMWPERAKTGAVRLALRCDVPIVPVAMLGAHEVLGRKRRPQVRTKVGEPIDVRTLMRIGPDVEPTPDEIRHGADLVMRALVRLVEDLRGETAPHPHGVPTPSA